MAVVLLLRLVQLLGYLGYLLLRAIRAAVEGAVAAAFAAAGDAVAAAADAAAGWRDAASSNSTAAVAFVQAAMGRPEALLAKMLAIFGLVALLRADHHPGTSFFRRRMEAPAGGGYLLGGQPARCYGGHSTGSNGEGFGGHPATSPPSSSWVSLPREHRDRCKGMTYWIDEKFVFLLAYTMKCASSADGREH
uniref:Uncharacterized protein n=1 Tax=Oryza sativa subsp. japonica TaxID=39947 RepID=Q2R8Z0_ORYSJ|nr:hypothetical protein LOC_Os11g10530 [Oryza sativa Japonica Group]